MSQEQEVDRPSISRAQIQRDREAILTVLRNHRGRPILYSQLNFQAGEGISEAFNELLREEVIKAVYPEAVPGNAGRQHWVLNQ